MEEPKRTAVTARRVLAGLVAAVAVLAIGASSASAVIQTASNSVTIAPGVVKPVSAACPGGTNPLSAGFAVGGFDTVDDGIVPMTSRRISGGTSAIGRNNSESVTGTFTDLAYCDTEPRSIVTRAATVALPADTSRTATALCPDGTKVVSGGFVMTRSSASSKPFPYASRRVANGWRVSALSFTDSGTLRALAYCESGGPNLTAVSESDTTDPSQYHGLATATPDCPGGTRPISGGFDGHYSATPYFHAVAPLVSRRIAGGWKVSGWSVSATVDGTLTGYAYCESL